MQNNGRFKTYTVYGLIPANTASTTITKDMDGSVTFHCLKMGTEFETLQLDTVDTVEGIYDYGVCTLNHKVVEGGTDYQFYDNFIPVDMFAAPGRKKSPRALNNATNAPVNPLYKRLDFPHTFTKKIDVQVENTGDVDCWVWFTFVGTETKSMTQS